MVLNIYPSRYFNTVSTEVHECCMGTFPIVWKNIASDTNRSKLKFGPWSIYRAWHFILVSVDHLLMTPSPPVFLAGCHWGGGEVWYTYYITRKVFQSLEFVWLCQCMCQLKHINLTSGLICITLFISGKYTYLIDWLNNEYTVHGYNI